MRYREVATPSGGQRQRAWFGMALAQETPVLLLDEPTTFLDIAAQIDLLDLARTRNREQGRTVVMILHDLNLAARYADRIVAMKAGEIVAIDTPTEVITVDLLREVFAIEASIITDPQTGLPLAPIVLLVTCAVEGLIAAVGRSALDGLLADATPAGAQGRVQANFAVVTAAGRLVGSAGAGLLYLLQPGVPFIVGGVICTLTGLALFLPTLARLFTVTKVETQASVG